ncbi:MULTISPECIES: hypothetical protein [unclassified Nonomuraea]|uniref:hypothetical protein n=1 Tax=unclassified Nonomuraea TaxID=2593643 RepID=UPI0033CFD43F
MANNVPEARHGGKAPAPAGALPVAAGYLSDAAGLTTGATVFGSVLAGLAVVGGLVVLAGRRGAAEPG